MTGLRSANQNDSVHPVLEKTRQVLATPLAGCSAAQLGRHPGGDPARWCARQVIEHLSATWQLTTNGIEDRLQKGRPLKTRPTASQRCMRFLICNCGVFPKGRKSPSVVEPPPTAYAAPVSGDELVARISATLAAMDLALKRIEPQAKGAPVLSHVLLGPLSVRDWRCFHRTHAQHHVKQIMRAIPSR